MKINNRGMQLNQGMEEVTLSQDKKRLSTRKKEREEILGRSISMCKGPVARGCLASEKTKRRSVRKIGQSEGNTRWPESQQIGLIICWERINWMLTVSQDCQADKTPGAGRPQSKRTFQGRRSGVK